MSNISNINFNKHNFTANFSKISFSKISNLSKKVLGISLLAVLSILQFTNISTHAVSAMMHKGQKADFVVEYSNVGDSPSTQAFLLIRIGDKLEVDTSSFTDQYGEGQIYCVSPSIYTTNKAVVGAWGGFINYRPRSAETTDVSTCKGESTPGFAELGSAANNTSKKGFFRFKATLRANITDPIGTVLTTDNNQGTFSRLGLDDRRGAVLKENSITIIANPNPVRTNLAKADPAKLTGGDFDGSKPQPIYTKMTFDPNPGITKAKFKITTSGLLDSGTGESLGDATCQTMLIGSNYSFVTTGIVTKGECVVNFTEAQSPTTIGTYQAVTGINGPNNVYLLTRPENVVFGQIVIPRTNLAKADPAKLTGGDFDGSKPQPIYSSMVFDTNPGITKQAFKITTNGLLDSGTNQALENATCQTTLKGTNYQFSASGNVVSGICVVNFAANETPTTIGDYQAVTKVKGPNGDLFTKAESVKFDEIVKAINVTVRTGGENLLIGGGIISIIVGISYHLTKKQKMQY